MNINYNAHVILSEDKENSEHKLHLCHCIPAILQLNSVTIIIPITRRISNSAYQTKTEQPKNRAISDYLSRKAVSETSVLVQFASGNLSKCAKSVISFKPNMSQKPDENRTKNQALKLLNFG